MHDAQTPAPTRVGVCGAGTMGAGIAQLSCQAGAHTLLFDPDAAALGNGAQRIAAQIARSAQRGRLTQEAAGAASGVCIRSSRSTRCVIASS
jgi:3-hydroxybutyryl-CoA dehydrogenase